MNKLITILALLVPASVFAEEHNCTEVLHPPVPLLDHAGVSVIESGKPISTMKSCGGCHDAEYIVSHSYHSSAGIDERFPMGTIAGRRSWDYSPGSFGRWNPLFYRYLSPPGDAQLDLGTAEWIQLFGWRHVGGGPAVTGHSGIPLDSIAEDSIVEGKAGNTPGVAPDRQFLDAATRQPRRWDWATSHTVEMNCFLCHTKQPDNDARKAELAAGRFGWANTATLRAAGVVSWKDDRWQYNTDKFSPTGTVEASVLGLTEPKSEHCGQCHGQTHFDESPLQLDLSLSAWSTATKGQVFSPQLMFDSAVNLADKQALGRPWDVHAAAMLECRSCHFSLNDPKSYEPSRRGRPSHLRYEPRRLSISEYVHHPSHQFAQGHTEQGTIARHLNGTMRSCDDCHNAESTHTWLPYVSVHLEHLSCEVCHIAETRAPAIRMVDWTMISPAGKPSVEWRGIAGSPRDVTSLVTGFRPTMLPKQTLDGKAKLSPYNLISAWYWVTGGPAPRPVRAADLQAALLTDGSYHPDVLAQFDTDSDGKLSLSERMIDSPEKQELVKMRLASVGVEDARIEAEVQAYGLHHGVGLARTAIRDCKQCHAANSRLGEEMVLASHAIGGVVPHLVGDGIATLNGDIQIANDGQLVFQPKTREADLYVLGHDRWQWLDMLGVLSLLAAIGGVVIHTGMRIGLRTRKGHQEHDDDNSSESQ